MIEDIISNANNFHGHLVAASDGRMPSLKLISSIEQLNEGEKLSNTYKEDEIEYIPAMEDNIAVSRILAFDLKQ